MALFVAGIVTVITLIFFGLKSYGRYEDTRLMEKTSIIHKLSKANIKQLAVEGRSSVGTLHVEEINGKRIGVYTFKTADSTEIRGVFPVANTGVILLQNGFPLSTGDGFAASYLPSDPQVHRVELFQPTKSTVSTYIKYALEAEQRNTPTDSKEKSLCRVLTVAEVGGWTALADFIFQDETEEQNPRHNRESYGRLMGTQAVAKGCWDK